MVLKVEVPPDLVHGDVDEGFGTVADAFRRNFAAGEEIGAACAIEIDGRSVVDLWGGYRDGRRRLLWQADTLVPVASATKGMAAAAMAVAHARGWFDLDAPVADHWPAFASCWRTRPAWWCSTERSICRWRATTTGSAPCSRANDRDGNRVPGTATTG